MDQHAISRRWVCSRERLNHRNSLASSPGQPRITERQDAVGSQAKGSRDRRQGMDIQVVVDVITVEEPGPPVATLTAMARRT